MASLECNMNYMIMIMNNYKVYNAITGSRE